MFWSKGLLSQLMLSLSSKGTTFFRVIWVGQYQSGAVFNILKKKKTGFISLNINSFSPSIFSTKISDSSTQISASDLCKLLLGIIWFNTHLTPVVFTRFGFPRIGFLFNFILFWILGIRYRLCTEHLNTDRGEAARFQKLLTTIKDNTILPKSSSLKWKEQTIVFLPLAKKQYLRDEYSGTN